LSNFGRENAYCHVSSNAMPTRRCTVAYHRTRLLVTWKAGVTSEPERWILKTLPKTVVRTRDEESVIIKFIYMASIAGPPIARDLPLASSPTLKLVLANPRQVEECWSLNGVAWKGPLSDEVYFRRERLLGSSYIAANGGITRWILIDEADKEPAPTILSACETFRKKALVVQKSTDEQARDIISHGIGSVFCRNEFRGKGYAGRMIAELSKVLETWQQNNGTKSLFNVLYSDIGKKFYARNGWMPFPSTHVSLPALPEGSLTRDLPKTRPLHANDLEELCRVDEEGLRKDMMNFGSTNAHTRVAFVPNADTMHWQHAREELVSEITLGKVPKIKGVIVDEPGAKRVWCIWSRVYQNDPDENVLYILRVGVEGEADLRTSGCEEDTRGDVARRIAACLQAAQIEAPYWTMPCVQMWNPSPEAIAAARLIDPSVEIVDRDVESISSLRWYGDNDGREGVEWVANEKFGWC